MAGSNHPRVLGTSCWSRYRTLCSVGHFYLSFYRYWLNLFLIVSLAYVSYLGDIFLPGMILIDSYLAPSGLFVIGGDTTNLVGLGGCTANNYISGLPTFCQTGQLRNPTMWLGLFLGG